VCATDVLFLLCRHARLGLALFPETNSALSSGQIRGDQRRTIS